MGLMAGATALSAWLIKPVVNDIFIARNRDALWLISFAILATFTLKGVSNYIQATLMAHVGMKIVAEMQNRLFCHISGLDLGFFHNNATGTLLSRFTIDIMTMRVAVTHGITVFGKDLLSLIGLVHSLYELNFKALRTRALSRPVMETLGGLHRIVLIMHGRGRTGEIIDLVHLDIEGEGHVVAYQLEPRITDQVNDIVFRPSE